MEEDEEYLRSHLPSLRDLFPGLWVVIFNGRVCTCGDDEEQARTRAYLLGLPLPPHSLITHIDGPLDGPTSGVRLSIIWDDDAIKSRIQTGQGEVRDVSDVHSLIHSRLPYHPSMPWVRSMQGVLDVVLSLRKEHPWLRQQAGGRKSHDYDHPSIVDKFCIEVVEKNSVINTIDLSYLFD
eukprot:TRINITY_DN10440_c0_g1_i1.p1 TRINITY_DN10440_c0_g1~~TRINITY_DN10440_c0_g1_i1.p1  ORF type:complete len:180 (+),score=37.69 TRINITY_DN10440_c0_g1_i1:29-568(+)